MDMIHRIKYKTKTKKYRVSLIKRGLSFIIDAYIGALFGTIPISVATTIILGEVTQNIFLLPKAIAIISLICSLLCLLFYYFYIPYKIYPGQTLGKRFFNIQIEYKNRKELWKRQVVGYILLEGGLTSGGKVIFQLLSILTGYNMVSIFNDIFTSISLFSIALLLLSSQHKMLHDYIAKTEVREFIKVT